ncbi:hypothetical protein KGM_211889 [Danaus plexippus plexippus]|uniref:Uncharacterized protein n=1 Tax=Danaus plexippus plexippus TaxID=278856 RepID=A0A212FL20_DANPL|nr:hypothetical protein KGM_211889 [Danaus plexippus plexippus]
MHPSSQEHEWLKIDGKWRESIAIDKFKEGRRGKRANRAVWSRARLVARESSRAVADAVSRARRGVTFAENVDTDVSEFQCQKAFVCKKNSQKPKQSMFYESCSGQFGIHSLIKPGNF